jgi:hypothetical protein
MKAALRLALVSAVALILIFSVLATELANPTRTHLIGPPSQSGMENSSVLIPAGVETNISSGGEFISSFVITAPGFLAGSAWPNCDCGFWYVLNDSNFNQSKTGSGGFGWNFEIDSPSGSQAVNASITFNLSLPAGSWHLEIINPASPPGLPPGQFDPGPTDN